MLKKGILALTSLVLIVLVLFISPTVWSQEPPRDTEALLDAMHIEAGDWVADVGSGEGEYTVQMTQVVGDSGRALAVDIDEDDLEELNEEIKDREIVNEVDTLRSMDRYDSRYWMMVSTRPVETGNLEPSTAP